MLTRDGVRLDADVYRPDAEGAYPVLLMRQPYGRSIASTIVYAHPCWYASQGYIVVIQDVRGRGTSEGEFKLFANEIQDGFDTVNWAAKLPGSNGKVGMYGFSYQGMTQLYAAAAKPAPLKTICPAMIGFDLYTDWAYENGAFRLQDNLTWAIQLATETARLGKNEKAYQDLYSAYRNLPLNDIIPACPDLLKNLAPDSHYHDWINHPKPDEYWKKLSPKTYFQKVDLPMLHVGGWFDTYLRGTVNLYKEMAFDSAFPQHLLIGPWAHLPWSRKVGEVDYSETAENPIDYLQIRWFDYFLKGIDTGILNELPICLFEMGSNLWKSFKKWPANNQKSYYLSSIGLANIKEDAGKLINPQFPISNSSTSDVLVHDPWRPVPALGGHPMLPAGSFDRSAIDSRTDVLTYTTEPLTQHLHIAGDVTIEIYCSADAPSFDICAVLSEVKNNGSVYNFTQGYVRVEPDRKTAPLKIALQPTCVRISRGNQLRLSLSAACFPAYPINPGTGSSPKETRLIEAQAITVTVRSGGKNASRILLPL